MNKLIKLATVLLAISAGIGAGPSHIIDARAAEGDKIPAAENYLRIGDKDTGKFWIQKDEMTGDKQPIIFFNDNPDWNISRIEKIYFRFRDGDDVAYNDDVVQYTEDYQFLVRRGRQLWLGGAGFPETSTTYSYVPSNQEPYDVGLFNQSGPVTNYLEYPIFSSPAKRKYYFNIPEMGFTTTIMDLFNLGGEIGDSNVRQSFIYEAKDTKDGFPYYQDLVNKYKSDFKYYLILPFTTTSNITIDYLALEAIDGSGNRITSETGAQEQPDSSFIFNVTKINGHMTTTNSAFYFPGSLQYRLIGVVMTSYSDNDQSKDYNPVLYCGDLVGKNEETATQYLTFSRVIPLENELELHYDFQGNNNGVLINIPSEVISCNIAIRYEKTSHYVEGTLDPFSLNLIGEDGNFGIVGGLPEETDPNSTNWWNKFLGWLSNATGISLPDFQTAFKWTGIALVGLLGLVLVSYLIRPLSTVLKALKKKK